jgi:peroxiredoxin Q/BCP
MLSPGDPIPDVSLTNQHGEVVTSESLRGHRTLVFFYPKADTPGCTTQACALRDVAGDIGDTVVIGISPDKAAAQQRFDTKYGLGFDLLADTEHAAAEAFGVWKEKKNYGRTYMGIERSAFLIAADGTVEQTWYKISPKDTPLKLLAALV